MPSPMVAPSAGIGLRHRHVADFLTGQQPVAWIEVHSETHLAAGGPRIAALETIRADYGLSCHSVGLSLGSVAGIDSDHLDRLADLYHRLSPNLISDHLSWSVQNGIYLNDLLPIPYTEEALAVVARNVTQVQDRLNRRLLVENPSLYASLPQSIIPEPEFLSELVRRTGCGLLLDVNNIQVCAHNLNFDPLAYLADFPMQAVEEIHVAGHLVHSAEQGTVLIDDHGHPVPSVVWDLLAHTLEKAGPRPVLVEWDTDVPELPVLLDQASQAQQMLDRFRAHAA